MFQLSCKNLSLPLGKFNRPDSSPTTLKVTSRQSDKYGEEQNEETVLDLRVSRSSSSTTRSRSPSEDNFAPLPFHTNRHSRIWIRPSKHGRQSQHVEAQAHTSPPEKKFHRRPGLRPARSRRHKVHTEVTNLSTPENISSVPSRRPERNRLCMDSESNHARFDYTSQLNLRAPIGQSDSCVQTCSSCNIEFKDAVSFVKHIQQIHVGLELDSNHTNSISSMDSQKTNYRISEWRTQGMDPSVNVPFYCADQATGTQDWPTRYPIVNYGPSLALPRNSADDHSFGEQCFVN
ncbi:hypothetical protein P879_08690 [Paragonimus westermani]|uniref:C2H2-type domain-containing protein n=1 Tax=Paragonimus westermani TaxID=34504 RepID=A0A8T0D3W5_9TREM|nr:hypothetical protein P879_08690 [Paragonimus westermani]